MKNLLSLSFLACILLLSCKSQMAPTAPSTKADASFIGTKWMLTKLNGDVLNLSKTELEQPFIKLSATDNGVGGNGGCNSFGGSFTLKEGQKIEFSQLLATMRYCEGSTIESVFMGNLQKAVAYTIINGELTLIDEDNHTLASFEPSTENTE